MKTNKRSRFCSRPGACFFQKQIMYEINEKLYLKKKKTKANLFKSSFSDTSQL